MPVTKEQFESLKSYCREKKINFREGSPSTYTGSVKSRSQTLLVNFENKVSLQKFVAWLNEQNKQNRESRISASVIGGGRPGDSNSYSIASLWEDTDVFIQLGWDPEIKIQQKEKKEKPHDLTDSDFICSIDPNIMLKELNQQLYDKGYHCPILFGALPFMSFAGGLSTNSHTAVGFLADVVDSVELLLPNGAYKTIQRDDEDFGLICDHASLGLLGIITKVNIRVKEGAKKLHRIEKSSTYSKFLDEIQHEIKSKREDLNSRAILITPNELSKDTLVKMTKWTWVDAKIDDKGADEKQVVVASATASISSFVAQNNPEIMASVLKWFVIPPQNTTIEKIKRPEMIMGPEAKLACNLTEVGLFFDYEFKKLSAFLDHLRALLQDYHNEEKWPVNMAIFIRFLKKEGSYKVAVDFASLGQNAHLEPFVMELIGYLRKHEMNPSLHQGKSSGIRMNKLCRKESREIISDRYQKFYREHKLDEALLKRKMRGFENFSQEIKTKIDNIFLSIASKNIMRIILACGEFGETLLNYYAGKGIKKIIEDLAKFAEQWINKYKLIPQGSIFHSIAAMINNESKFKHAAEIALSKGIDVFKALLNVSHAQNFGVEKQEIKQAIKNGIKCFCALSHLNSTTKIKHKDSLSPLKATGQTVLQKTKKAINNCQIPLADLSRLTKYINGTATVVAKPDEENILAHAQNTSEIFGIKREWGGFIGCALVATLCSAMVLSSLAIAITTFGVSTPVSAFITALVLSHVSKFIAVTAAALGFVLGAPSVVMFSHFSHRGRKGGIAVAGARVEEAARKAIKDEPDAHNHPRPAFASL